MSFSSSNTAEKISGTRVMGRRIKKLIPIIIFLLILGFFTATRDDRSEVQDLSLTVSGTIEPIEVTIAFEIGGTIDQILVKKGDRVQSGDILIRLEDDVLKMF
jgi:multidrug efflux pump subunit AcrA (membrane-fusion protein)